MKSPSKFPKILYAVSLAIQLIVSVGPTAAFIPTVSNLQRSSTSSSTVSTSHNLAAQGPKIDKTKPAPPPPFLSPPEEKVYDLLQELNESQLPFRVVVVGNGAILESTSLLGPSMRLSQSPSTGANLVTFASEDASFEFHLMVAQVSKVAMVEKQSPSTGKTMRIVRFLDGEEPAKSICSLILAEDSDAAGKWYQKLLDKHGQELQIV
jgi:hypothetical protein